MPASDGSTICVYKTESQIEEDETDPVVVERIISDLDEERANELYRRLNCLDVDHGYEVPIYDVFCHHIWRDGGTLHDESPYSLELLILLYERLEEHIDGDIQHLECYGIGGRYADLLRDFAAIEGLTVTFVEEPTTVQSDLSILWSGLLKLLLTVADLLLSLLLRPLFRPSAADIVVDYSAGRPDTLRSIERQLDIQLDAFFTPLTVSYLKDYRSLSAAGTTDVPVFCTSTVRGLFSQLAIAITFAFDTLSGWRTEPKIVAAVEDETGLRLERTVGRLYRRAAAYDMAALLRYGPARRTFERGQYSVLLLTSTGPAGKALGLAARAEGATVYLLPHSITNQYTALESQFQHTVFSEGSIARSLLASDPLLRPVETGLPKHQKIRNQRDQLERQVDDGTVLVGTQPYDDDRRETFVVDVVTSVLEVTDRPVVVKVHPGETTAFYRDTLRTADLTPTERERVTVTGKGLYRHIVDSDLLVTISSNVGIESVILGTPSVSYNPWSPDNRTPLYCKYGSVPHVTTPAAFRDLLNDGYIDSLADEQVAMLDGPYAVMDNSLDRIASRIETELKEQLTNTESW